MLSKSGIRLGLIGGISWTSTIYYYKAINSFIQEFGLPVENIYIDSLNFSRIEEFQRTGSIDKLNSIVRQSYQKLKEIDCDFILITSNTMSMAFENTPTIKNSEYISIRKGLVKAFSSNQVNDALLLGTGATARSKFYTSENLGIKNLRVPSTNTQHLIDSLIYDNLTKSIDITDSCIRKIRSIVEHLNCKQHEAILLGCTELSLVANLFSNFKIIDSSLSHINLLIEEINTHEINRTD